MKIFWIIPTVGQRIKIIADRYILMGNKIEFESNGELKAFFFISNISGVTINNNDDEEPIEDGKRFM